MNIDTINSLEDLFHPAILEKLKKALCSGDENQIKRANAIFAKFEQDGFLKGNATRHIELYGRLGIIEIDKRTQADVTELEKLIFEAKKLATEKKKEKSKLYLKKLNEIRKYVTSHPESINERWTFQETPLHESACWGLEKLVTLLLACHPDTSLKNVFGDTAAERAHRLGYTTIAQLISPQS